MELQELILPFIQNSPKFKAKLEGIFNQPADHVIKAFNQFMDNVNGGPGLQDTEKAKQEVFSRLYQGGMAMGFTDWESELMAASIAGYTPMDVCLSFRNKRGWKDTTVEKVQSLMDAVAPRFFEQGRASGLLPKEEEVQQGIPSCERTTTGGVAPWEMDEYKPKTNDVKS